jgi:hypothetical protein
MYAPEDLSQFRSFLAWKQAWEAREVGYAKASLYGGRINQKCWSFAISSYVSDFFLSLNSTLLHKASGRISLALRTSPNMCGGTKYVMENGTTLDRPRLG